MLFSQYFPLNLFDQMTHRYPAYANVCAALEDGHQDSFTLAINERHTG